MKLTKFQALYVKVLRIRWEYSYKRIAEEWNKRYKFDKPFIAKQRIGRELCYFAELTLNEEWEDR